MQNAQPSSWHSGDLQGEKRRPQLLPHPLPPRVTVPTRHDLQEVSNALMARDKLVRTRVEQNQAVQSYHEAMKIALEHYQVGDSSYYEVLQAQQQLFPAENSLGQTQLNDLLAVVQLYCALGDGWQREEVVTR